MQSVWVSAVTRFALGKNSSLTLLQQPREEPETAARTCGSAQAPRREPTAADEAAAASEHPGSSLSSEFCWFAWNRQEPCGIPTPWHPITLVTRVTGKKYAEKNSSSEFDFRFSVTTWICKSYNISSIRIWSPQSQDREMWICYGQWWNTPNRAGSMCLLNVFLTQAPNSCWHWSLKRVYVWPLWEYKGQGDTKTINQDEWLLSLKNGFLAHLSPKGAEERRRLMAWQWLTPSLCPQGWL